MFRMDGQSSLYKIGNDMKSWKKELLKEWWNNNLDYLPLGAKFRGKWQKAHVAGIIRELDDRLLDINIAKKVFGYEINVGERTEYEEYGGQIDYPELQYVKEVHKNGSFDGKSDWKEWEALPHYSTDIKDAFLIVDKFTEDNIYCYIECKYEQYICSFYKEEKDSSIPRKTLSESICASALDWQKLNDT
jgi:hypothetical protein